MASKLNQDGITDRVNSLIEESEMSNRGFAIKCQLDPSGFDKKTKGQLVWTVNDMNKISEMFNIRKGWLIDGEGQKYKAPDEILDTIPAVPTMSFSSRAGVPYYDVCFELGFDIMENDQTTIPSYRIDFQPYNKCDAWCNARGDSMAPTISSGDMIALKRIEDFHFLISGEIYAIVTTNDLRTIKRVKDNVDTLTLIPDNKEYPEQTISKNDVRFVYQVMGSMKRF